MSVFGHSRRIADVRMPSADPPSAVMRAHHTLVPWRNHVVGPQLGRLPGDVEAMDQQRQERDQLDAAVVPFIRGERCAATASRPGQ